MRIGIVGAGSIGCVLAARLSSAGHDVKLANSRGPETLEAAALEAGATAVWAADVTANTDVVIVSVNFGRIPAIADLVQLAPENVVIIDLTNHYPNRDGRIEGLGNGQTESAWAQEQYGRPLVKAWSTITTESLAGNATTPGTPGRIGLPVLSDDESHRRIVMSLVEQTGFDAFDAGTIADSWRVQPGTPAYATDLTAGELPQALLDADGRRAARRRDLMTAVLEERGEAGQQSVDPAFLLALTRLLFSESPASRQLRT
jgi:predicted dinucleotide-binding enzyme